MRGPQPPSGRERERALREAITAAFVDERASVPSATTVDRCPSCEKTAATLRGRSWRALSIDELEGLASAMRGLSARALRAYAAAFMLRGLEHPGSPAALAFLERVASPDDRMLTNDAHRTAVLATRDELVAVLRTDPHEAVLAFARRAARPGPLRSAARRALAALEGHERSP